MTGPHPVSASRGTRSTATSSQPDDDGSGSGPLRVWRFADSLRVPWRNGGGTSRTLRPEQGGDGWWVSIAALDQPGPFSVYPGVRRVFTPLGAAVELAVDDAVRHLPPGEPIPFDGGATAVLALPDGPAAAVNVFADRARYRLDVRVQRGAGPVEASSAVVVLEGSARLPDGQVLGTFDLAEDATRGRGSALFEGTVLAVDVVAR